ncbi:SMI1/KNR4 family protein [Providencia sp. PROV257]|uniref:SMI1/KNR4 family protein n=1 Tax=Providencia sp. PROV257 TaxID=2949945 RepID=UPI00234AE2CC|nr:SMI1/KNR4 family protein [Providencia sp. PROV257]
MKISKLFHDGNLVIEYSLPGISEDVFKQCLPFDFSGKNELFDLYSSMNGGYFSKGAYFYRDIFYDVPYGYYNAMEIESFYFIPEKNQSSDALRSIPEVWQLRKKNLSTITDFFDCRIPFAGDAGDHDFCLNINSGEIEYFNLGLNEEEDEYVIVAPSFRDFCTNIQSTRRK